MNGFSEQLTFLVFRDLDSDNVGVPIGSLEKRSVQNGEGSWSGLE